VILIVMRHRKVLVGVVLLVLFAWIAILVVLPNRPILAWKVARIRPVGQYWIRDGMEPHCWGAQVVVSNLSSSEVIVDWRRDETAFQVDGQWESLGISALLTHLDPNEARTVSLIFPQRAQACRFLMHYELGPSWERWSRVDQFLKNHGLRMLPDKLLQISPHYRRLLIEVRVPDETRKRHETSGT
jgi:hypothetical protein